MPRIYKFLRLLEQIIQTVNCPFTDDFTIVNESDFSQLLTENMTRHEICTLTLPNNPLLTCSGSHETTQNSMAREEPIPRNLSKRHESFY
jgi:hypothetical protein